MKRVQFSLSAVLALMLLASSSISFARQFSLHGARTAFEHLLLLVWLLSLLASFWKSAARGWNRVVQATVITTAVWFVLVIGTHLMFARAPGHPVFAFQAI